jgi:hypothetical protein
MPEEKQEGPKGECAFIKKPEGGFSSPFFEALMRFQYGETAEISNQGFEQLLQSASSGRIPTSIYAFSRVHVIKTDFNRDKLSDLLQAEAVSAAINPYLDSLEQAVGKDLSLSEFLPGFSIATYNGQFFPILNTKYSLTFGHGWGENTARILDKEGRMETKLDIIVFDPGCVGGSTKNFAYLGKVEYKRA